jgi:hypothetical protein
MASALTKAQHHETVQRSLPADPPTSGSYFFRKSLWQALHTSRVCSNATLMRARLPLAAALLRSAVLACNSMDNSLKRSSSSQTSSLARVSPHSVPAAKPSQGSRLSSSTSRASLATSTGSNGLSPSTVCRRRLKYSSRRGRNQGWPHADHSDRFRGEAQSP